MIARAAVVIVLLAGAGLYSARAGSVEAVVPRQPLASLPLVLGNWHGREAAPLADDVLGQLGVDDYVNRQYARPDAAAPIGIYVGYYASQRQGDTIHSPQNCLPGAGWLPVETAVTELKAGDRRVRVNEFVIQKGLDRQVVLYWYQGRGRVTANEYANKALLMLDAARLHRTNGGLVRLIAPVTSTTDAARSELAAFAAVLFGHLDGHLP
jgi:EpsI family protein